MLKKLQELLFEEEDEELSEEEEEEEEVVEVKPSRRRPAESAPSPKPAPQPAPEPAKPVMSRVEMTQPIQIQKEEPKPAQAGAFSSGSVFKTPSSVQHASPRPIQDPVLNVKTVEQPKSSFSGLTLDSRKKEEAAPKAKPAQKPKSSSARTASVYEFKPVISPMFGVDEKDMEAMALTATAVRSNPTSDENVSKVISPIYGSNLDASAISSNQAAVDKSNRIDNAAYTKANRRSEDRIPEFSLDDILSARDDEFSHNVMPSAPEIRTPDVDETVVIDSKHLESISHRGSAESTK